MKFIVIIGKYFWRLFYNSKRFRRILFDSHTSNKILLASHEFEKFIVYSKDKIIGRDVYINGQFDFKKLQKTLKILGKNFKPDLLIDVGANIGTICIPSIKRKVFKKAFAFEPDPFNYSLLCANIYINNLNEKILSYNYAITNKNNIDLKLEISAENLGDHRIITNKKKVGNFVKVKGKKLDSFFRIINPKKTLIWIDTQGHEGFILEGAKKILNKKTPLVIEFWPQGMFQSSSYVLLKKILCNSPYNKFYNLDDKNIKAYNLDEKELDNLYSKIGEYGNFVDLLIL